ncbi:MAG: hypothetical protein KGL39_43545 [Patescibacteria group bacterium]|nr:hypothetical protein [Patescibacteria group bacterium]
MTATTDRPLKYSGPATALSLWRSALPEEIGIRFSIDPNDVSRLRPEMYKARKDAIAAEPELGELQLLMAPGLTEMFIVKKAVELE